jgi:molybdate transport system substrate-binding protein
MFRILRYRQWTYPGLYGITGMKTISAALILVAYGFASIAQERIVVAAASDLKFALDSAVKLFNTKNPGRVEVIYGSSGKLTEQILNGAPFHVFFSADITYPKKIQEQGHASSPIHTYAKGRIVIWSKSQSLKLDDMNVLRDPSIRKSGACSVWQTRRGKSRILRPLCQCKTKTCIW